MKLSLSEQVMHNVLHITMLNADGHPCGTATGFLFGFCDNDSRHITCLVTNRHVLANCAMVRISFTREKEKGVPDIGNLCQVDMDTKDAILHPNPSIDLSILPIGGLINALIASGNHIFYTYFNVGNIPKPEEWKNYCAIEDVVMAGFPKGFRDKINNQPIFRSGITATHPALDFMGRPEFLVDMPCFEGCSGSPVLICDEGLHINKRTNSISAGNKIALLGIQYAIPKGRVIGELATVPSDNTTSVPIMPLYINIGFIIKSTELLAFENLLRAKYDLETHAAVV